MDQGKRKRIKLETLLKMIVNYRRSYNEVKAMFGDPAQMPVPKTLISPLRYPGSKRRLVDYISEALRINGIRPSLFIEPFVGGGSVVINLLKKNL